MCWQYNSILQLIISCRMSMKYSISQYTTSQSENVKKRDEYWQPVGSCKMAQREGAIKNNDMVANDIRVILMSVFGPEGVLNQRVNAACLFPGWWCKENTRGFILVRAKESPTSSGGEEVCISLHRSARVGVTSMRERAPSPSLKERKKGQGWLLEVSISCFSSLSVVVRSGASFSPLLVEPWPALL
jgi:hypothetical protein